MHTQYSLERWPVSIHMCVYVGGQGEEDIRCLPLSLWPYCFSQNQKLFILARLAGQWTTRIHLSPRHHTKVMGTHRSKYVHSKSSYHCAIFPAPPNTSNIMHLDDSREGQTLNQGDRRKSMRQNMRNIREQTARWKEDCLSKLTTWSNSTTSSHMVWDYSSG